MAGEKDGDKGFSGVRRKWHSLMDRARYTIRKIPSKKTTKVILGSHYIPDGKRVGDDAHFFCTKEQVIGIADGISSWAKHGIDAGQYARELMDHAETVVQEKKRAFIKPATVMRKAYSRTCAMGSSTACIIALNSQDIHAAIVGDSGFLVVRDGQLVYRSPVQLHDTDRPYQLGASDKLDDPSCAEVVKVAAKAGDVIVAGTDGLFDNVFEDELTRLVYSGLASHSEPQELASVLANVALDHSNSMTGETPYSKASEEAGKHHMGGKRDDITVVVMYIRSIDE